MDDDENSGNSNHWEGMLMTKQEQSKADDVVSSITEKGIRFVFSLTRRSHAMMGPFTTPKYFSPFGTFLFLIGSSSGPHRKNSIFLPRVPHPQVITTL